jgi:hypothetical protein
MMGQTNRTQNGGFLDPTEMNGASVAGGCSQTLWIRPMAERSGGFRSGFTNAEGGCRFAAAFDLTAKPACSIIMARCGWEAQSPKETMELGNVRAGPLQWSWVPFLWDMMAMKSDYHGMAPYL